MSAYAVFLLLLPALATSNHNEEFILSEQLMLHGVAEIQPDGSVVKPINATAHPKGQVFYTLPLQFKDSPSGSVSSFSTFFIFSIDLRFPLLLSEDISFVISPAKLLPEEKPSHSHYIEHSNEAKQQNSSNNLFSIELSTRLSRDFKDVDDTHLGININGVTISEYSPLGYFGDKNGKLNKIKLTSGEPLQVWVEYNGKQKELNVTLAPVSVPKPSRPLLSVAQDLSSFFLEKMYVGISTSNIAAFSSHSILGWSFKMNGHARDFDHNQIAKFTSTEVGVRIRVRGVQAVNWTFVELKCICVSNETEFLLNYSKEDRAVGGSNRKVGGKIWAA